MVDRSRPLASPVRGDIWWVDFNPTRGREQAGMRPALVISSTVFNQGPAQMAIVVPITTRQRNVPTHIRIQPPEGGVKKVCFAMCEQIRSISMQRFDNQLGALETATLNKIGFALSVLLEL